MNSMETTFSIIMPIYNAEKYLASAISSILTQSFKDFELILIDDGSVDGSAKICDEYAKKDSRIRVLHKENGGICQTRNTGLTMASGRYIGFMDNDDIVERNMLMDCWELLQKYEADWIKFGKREILVMDGVELSQKETNFKFQVLDNSQIKEQLLKLREVGAMTFIWDSFFKKEFLDEINLKFDEKFKLGNEDIDFCEQYALTSNCLVVTDKIYYNHFTRMGISASTKYSADKIKSYLYLLSKSNKRYVNNNILTENNELQYLNIVTKQIVVNICQRLNDAGKTLSLREKLRILRKCRENNVFEIYVSSSKMKLNKRNLKLFIYHKLFVKKHYVMLLGFDKYTRKLVYTYRAYKAKRLKKGKKSEQ